MGGVRQEEEKARVWLGSEPVALFDDGWPGEGHGVWGALFEFRGIVRDREKGEPIKALFYEAYEGMALRQMKRIMDGLLLEYGVCAAGVWHRTGWVAVGECSLLVRVAGKHRREGFLFGEAFIERLKADVPIWKADWK